MVLTGAGVVADIAVPAERGSFFGFFNIGPMVSDAFLRMKKDIQSLSRLDRLLDRWLVGHCRMLLAGGKLNVILSVRCKLVC